jgi:hypothetical protein
MSKTSRRRRHRLSRDDSARGALAKLALIAVLAAGCGARPLGDAHGASASPTFSSVSLATSIETSAGSWAIVPMGRLDQPLNTFWQLFYRPNGVARWSDKASALAVATNGGLLLATGNGRSIAVGVRPANLLNFSPLMVTSDDGSSLSPVSPVSALAEQPDALAIGVGGQSLALTTAGGGEVVESAAGLSGWHELTTLSGLNKTPPGRACRLVSMTAVAVVAGHAVIGADCRNGGEVGIFASQGAWRLIGPRLPAVLADGTVTVLGLQRTDNGLCAVLEVSKGHDRSLVAAWTTGAGATWRISPVLDLGSKNVVSLGPDGSTGLFVLESSTGASHSIAIVSGPGENWRRLPSPPSNTETLVFGPGNTVDALTVNDITFTDFELAAGGASWTEAQVMNVPIEFGSSS